MFILSKDTINLTPQEIDGKWHDYENYVTSNEHLYPKNAFDFAHADFHYDFNNSMSAHDAWIESMEINVRSSGDRNEIRDTFISIKLLGAYQDGYITLHYPKVYGFKISRDNDTYGDWLLDEVRLSEKGHVVHEVEFSKKGLLLIESNDIIYNWQPFS